MSAFDDYLDVKAAWEEYEKAFELWYGDRSGQTPRPSMAVQSRAATRVIKASIRLHDVAVVAMDGMHRRGWKKGRVGWHCTRCLGEAKGYRPDIPLCPGCRHANCGAANSGAPDPRASSEGRVEIRKKRRRGGR